MAKRNLKRIPATIIERISTFDQDDVVVACAKFLKPSDIERYSHLGLATDGTKLITPPPRVPDPTSGRFSRANVEGYEKVRKDLPKVSKEFGFDLPNWGDWSNGSHYVSWSREVYHRDFYPPKEVDLSITILEERDGGYLVRFAIDQVINRRTKNFEQELFYNLNCFKRTSGQLTCL